MARIERLLQKKQELQGSFDLLSQKLVRLRNARVLEENPGDQFELDHQIEKLEAERANVEHYIEAIEALSDVTDIEEENSRIEFGFTVIIEKLQLLDNHLCALAERVQKIINHLGLLP
jgi:DNA repair exonuclease SbcCD ATPase subunit